MGLKNCTFPSLIAGCLINRGSKVHLALVIVLGGGNKLKLVNVSGTSLDWGLSNRLVGGVTVKPLIVNIREIMQNLGESFKSLISLD